MSLEIKNRTLIIGILIAILLIFLLGWSIGRRGRDRGLQSELDSLNGKINYYKAVIEDQEAYIAQVTQQITTQKEALAKGELDKETLKALNLRYASEVTRLKGQIRILADSIASTGNVIIVRDCDTATVDTTKAIQLPFTFSRYNQHYQVHGGFDTNGEMSLALAVPLKVNVITGYNRQTKQYTASVITDNPFVFMNGVESIKLDKVKPKPWGVGVFAGYGVSFGDPLRATPIVGLGLSYNLIRW